MSNSKVNKNANSSANLPATKPNEINSLTVVTAQDDQLIEALEKSIQEESLKAEEGIAKLNDGIAKHENRKKELQEIKNLLNYWQEAERATNLLNREDVKPEVVLTIATEDGVCSLRSTKMETVKAVIGLLSESSKERMKHYFDQETK